MLQAYKKFTSGKTNKGLTQLIHKVFIILFDIFNKLKIVILYLKYR